MPLKTAGFAFGLTFGLVLAGPVAAQLGRGQLVALFTIAGVLTGSMVHDLVRRRGHAGVPRRVPEPTAVVGL